MVRAFCLGVHQDLSHSAKKSHSICEDPLGGGGGNRTRVLRRSSGTSPGAVCCAFLSPGIHADKMPTGTVTVRCPAGLRDRGLWLVP
jgi:hypothetical protein